MTATGIVHTFVIRNAGDAPLRVRRIRAACNCMVAGAPDNAIPAGGSCPLTVHLSLKDLAGFQRKAIFIESDDPAQPVLRLELAGTVLVEVEARPRLLVLYQSESGGARPRSIAVASRSNQPFAICSVELPRPDMRFAIRPEGQARFRIEITGSRIGDDLAGKFIVIRTDRAGMDPLRVLLAVRPNP